MNLFLIVCSVNILRTYAVGATLVLSIPIYAAAKEYVIMIEIKRQ